MSTFTVNPASIAKITFLQANTCIYLKLIIFNILLLQNYRRVMRFYFFSFD